MTYLAILNFLRHVELEVASALRFTKYLHLEIRINLENKCLDFLGGLDIYRNQSFGNGAFGLGAAVIVV